MQLVIAFAIQLNTITKVGEKLEKRRETYVLQQNNFAN